MSIVGSVGAAFNVELNFMFLEHMPRSHKTLFPYVTFSSSTKNKQLIKPPARAPHSDSHYGHKDKHQSPRTA